MTLSQRLPPPRICHYYVSPFDLPTTVDSLPSVLLKFAKVTSYYRSELSMELHPNSWMAPQSFSLLHTMLMQLMGFGGYNLRQYT